MTKDYAKRRAPLKQERKKTPFLTFLAIAAAMLIPFGFFYVNHHQAINHKGHAITHLKPATKPAEAPKPELVKFDFYTVLPEMEVVTPPDEETKETSKTIPAAASVAKAPNEKSTTAVLKPTTTPASVPSIAGIYFLRIAALRNAVDAENFMKQLSALPCKLFLQKIIVDQTTWYRIMAGPFASYENALAIRKRLKQDRLDVTLLKIKS
jgi:cell division septation protein DedD